MGGLLPDDAGGRDAVHVAVVSAVSDVRLRPGQDVGVEIRDGRDVRARAVSGTTEGVGIVDPYLKAIVEPGQRFWLYLYPRSITGLNHNWSHPAFPDAKPGEVYATPGGKLAAEQWLKNFANTADVPSYEEMMSAAIHAAREDDDYVRFGTDAGGAIPDEFWGYFEQATGMKAPKSRPEYFSCAC